MKRIATALSVIALVGFSTGPAMSQTQPTCQQIAMNACANGGWYQGGYGTYTDCYNDVYTQCVDSGGSDGCGHVRIDDQCPNEN